MAAPTYHTSLLTAADCRGHVHLIIGSNSLAGKRCEQSLATGATPIVIASDTPSSAPLHYGLAKLVEAKAVTWLRQDFTRELLTTLGREDVDHVVDAVFVTTTNLGFSDGKQVSAQEISTLCKRARIPINVTDSPSLCTFSLLSTHTDGPLQIGITTNGRGCHLASRIRREVAASLPSNLGAACARLGEVRRRVQEEDRLAHEALEDSSEQAASFNRLVTEEDLDAAKTRRMRWLSQVCEYWPLKRLAAISDQDVEVVLTSYPGSGAHDTASIGRDPNGPAALANRGRIILAGSGPGHPDLLTRATHKAILAADVILADKLVPAGVLDLIPRRTPVSIARKFPGNADQAQEELLEQALAGVQAGKTVLRLKQGDPFIYGRGGEEVAYFRARGLGDRVVVLPGITSALSAPLFVGVPPTQRDVADQVLVCTGTGKKGKPPSPPEYVASRTCVFLMALHRIGGLVGELTRFTAQELGQTSPPAQEEGPQPNGGDSHHHDNTIQEPSKPTRALWPLTTPCAVIERASCPDQRVIRTTLQHVEQAIEEEGSRPPGLLVVGRACEALYTPETGRAWIVEEGFRGLDVEDVVARAARKGMASLE
ncbi:uroporphyrin-III C-methyltransferase [Gnomoniopsis sp. IMI 355080]|nr:uroporphyrin-III C-methyltransferase [Gnomoniopsis sp. IMI 355080]